MAGPPTNVLIQYTMQGQLLTNSGPNAYEWVYWDVYNAPDMTGAQSGYFGQLQNIAISSQANVSSPTSGAVTPTSAAGGDLSGFYPNPQVSGLQGAPIVGTPTAGQELQFTGTQWVPITPTALAEPTPVVSSTGGMVNIPINNASWNESSASIQVSYQLQADNGTYRHIIGWLSGAPPSVLAPAGWLVQSPVDGVTRGSYVYGTGGNPLGERYTWRAIVALQLMVPA